MYTILLTVSLDAVARTVFFVWLWYRLTVRDHPLMLDYVVPTAIPSAPYSFSDSGSESIPGKGGM